MTTSYVLAPNYRYYVNSVCGVPAVGGTISTLDAITGLPRSTYSDPAGLNANPPVMVITADGSPGYPIYWQIVEGGSLYRVVVRDKSGSLIWIAPNYPINETISGGNIINLSVNASNYFRNDQYSFWHQGTFFEGDTLPVGITQTADDWYFERSNATADIQISRIVWPAGSPEAPFSPAYGWQYQVLSPSADPNSDHFQQFKSVQTLNNQQVSVGFYAQTGAAATTAQVTILTYQYFGVAGSVPVETIIQTVTLTDSMALQQVTYTVPNIAGATIDPNGGDYLRIIYRFNPNLIQIVQIAEQQFQEGIGTGLNYPYKTVEQQFSDDIQLQLINGEPGQGTDLITIPGKAEYVNLTEWIDDVAPQNFLIGWNFYTNPFQFGLSVKNATVVPNNDGTYIADQTILISDGDDIVYMLAYSGVPGGAPLSLNVVTPDRKFGIFQIIEEKNCFELYGQICSAMISIAVNNPDSVNFKIAIVSFTGVSGQELRQVVVPGAWGGPGVDPTLNTGWSYLSSQAFTATPTNPMGVGNMYGISNVTVPTPFSVSGFKTLGVMVWVDDPTPLIVGSYIAIYQGSLTQTLAYAPCAPETINETLDKCKRYFKKSYLSSGIIPWGYIPTNPSYVQVVNSCPVIAHSSSYVLLDTIVGGILTTGPFYSVGAPNSNVILNTIFVSGPPAINGGYIANIFSLNVQDIVIPFGNSMAKIPTVTIYNSSTGTSGSVNLSYQFAAGPNCSGTLNGITTVNPNISDIRSTTEQVTFTLGSGQSQCWSAVSTLLNTNGSWEFTFNAPQAACEYVADALLGV